MASDAVMQVARLGVEETLSLGERAYRRLRASIVQGALAPGAKVSERGLASALGISAQPVREALRRLEQDGLVVTLPRRGTVVAEIGPERLAELGRIRAALEGVAAALAAERMSEADLAALAAVVKDMRAATAAAEHETLWDCNERFHALVQGATGNMFLIRSLEALHAFDGLGRPRALGSMPNELPRALREHVAILAALRARDAELAEARMRAHVLRSLVTNRVLSPKRRRKP